MKAKLITLTLGLMLFLPISSFALDESTTTVTTKEKEGIESEETATNTPVKLFTLCSQEAIEARDTAISASRQVYNLAMTSALNERKVREKAAVALSHEGDKKAAIKASVETYKAQTKAAQGALTQARKLTWQAFDEAIQACRDTQEEQVITQDEKGKEMSSLKKASHLEESKKEDTETNKGLKDVLKAQIESIKSLFR